MSESEICSKIAHYAHGPCLLCCFGRKRRYKQGRMTRLVKLAQHTNARELETVDMPEYIRIYKWTKLYMRLLVYNILILTLYSLFCYRILHNNYQLSELCQYHLIVSSSSIPLTLIIKSIWNFLWLMKGNKLTLL